MTWKALFALTGLGALIAFQGGFIRPGSETQTLAAPLAGAPVAGRIPSGQALFERGPDGSDASVEIEALDLPEGIELDAWVNARGNAPCTGDPLGVAQLEADGSAGWAIDWKRATRPEIVAGSFVSVCAGGDPLLSGNLRHRSARLARRSPF